MYFSIYKQYVKISKLLWHAILTLPRNGLKTAFCHSNVSTGRTTVLLPASYGWNGPAQVSPLNRARWLQGNGENYTSRSFTFWTHHRLFLDKFVYGSFTLNARPKKPFTQWNRRFESQRRMCIIACVFCVALYGQRPDDGSKSRARLPTRCLSTDLETRKTLGWNGLYAPPRGGLEKDDD